jgi:hypothetical protein
MAAENWSPAVASRRAKYVGDFRVPTLLGAQPLGAKGSAPPTSPYGAGAAVKSVTLAWPAWRRRPYVDLGVELGAGILPLAS